MLGQVQMNTNPSGSSTGFEAHAAALLRRLWLLLPRRARAWAAAGWRWLRCRLPRYLWVLGRVLFTCRLPVAAVLVGNFLIYAVPQGADALIATDGPYRVLLVAFAGGALAFAAWFWSRFLLGANRTTALDRAVLDLDEPGVSGKGDAWIADWHLFLIGVMPRLLACGVLIGPYLAFREFQDRLALLESTPGYLQDLRSAAGWWSGASYWAILAVFAGLSLLRYLHGRWLRTEPAHGFAGEGPAAFAPAPDSFLLRFLLLRAVTITGLVWLLSFGTLGAILEVGLPLAAINIALHYAQRILPAPSATPPGADAGRASGRYSALVAGYLAAIAVSALVLWSRYPNILAAPRVLAWYLIFLVALLALLALFLLAYRTWAASPGGSEARPLSRAGALMIGLCFGYGFNCIALGAADPVAFGGTVGTIGVYFSFGVAMIAVGSIISWLASVTRLPLFAALLLLAWLGGGPTHPVGRPADGVSLAAAGDKPAVGRPTLEQALDSWMRRGDDPSRPMLMVAVEGGASRSGYFAALALARVADQLRADGRDGLLQQALFATSSVSGGSLGVGAMDLLLRRGGREPDAAPCVIPQALRDEIGRVEDPVTYAHCTEAFFRGDFLGPVMAAFLTGDIVEQAFPFLALPDRAMALERSWEERWAMLAPDDPRMAGPFLGELPGADAPVPVVAYNGTWVEGGRRIVTTNIEFDGARQLHDVLDWYWMTGLDIPYSTAINNSARFPYLEPAGAIYVDRDHFARLVESELRPVVTLQENAAARGEAKAMQQDPEVIEAALVERVTEAADLGCVDSDDGCLVGHIADGGYFENYGVTTLLEILHSLRRLGPAAAPAAPMVGAGLDAAGPACGSDLDRAVADGRIRPIMLLISGDPNLSARFTDDGFPDTPVFDPVLPAPLTAFTQLVAVPTALLNIRGGHATLAVERARQYVEDWRRDLAVATGCGAGPTEIELVHLALCDASYDAAMSWQLSTESLGSIRNSLGGRMRLSSVGAPDLAVYVACIDNNQAQLAKLVRLLEANRPGAPRPTSIPYALPPAGR